MRDDRATTRYVNPYTNPAHDEWVARGQCDSIGDGKVWCQGRAGHDGEHFAGNGYPEDPPPSARIQWTREHPRDLGVPVVRAERR